MKKYNKKIKITDYIEVCKYIMGFSFSLNWYMKTSTLPKPFKHRFTHKKEAIKMKKSLYNLSEPLNRKLRVYKGTSKYSLEITFNTDEKLLSEFDKKTKIQLKHFISTSKSRKIAKEFSTKIIHVLDLHKNTKVIDVKKYYSQCKQFLKNDPEILTQREIIITPGTIFIPVKKINRYNIIWFYWKAL